MNCPHCRQPNGPERNFCGGCGVALVQFCRGCGFRNQAADRYCGACGASLIASEGVAPRPVLSTGDGPSAALAAGGGRADLDELLEAAREKSDLTPVDGTVRVSQDDIDSLFGD